MGRGAREGSGCHLEECRLGRGFVVCARITTAAAAQVGACLLAAATLFAFQLQLIARNSTLVDLPLACRSVLSLHLSVETPHEFAPLG